ncbi:MAG: hypothetical protein L0K95_14650 [Tetragenococcus koreensis]|nr:hypothetical protein [Tetragenococcus koreensis]
MIHIKSATTTADNATKISFQDTSQNGTKINGHYLIEFSEFEEKTFASLKQETYTRIVSDFEDTSQFNITNTMLLDAENDREDEDEDNRDTVRVEFNGTSGNLSHVSGYYLMDKEDYVESSIKEMKGIALTKIKNEFNNVGMGANTRPKRKTIGKTIRTQEKPNNRNYTVNKDILDGIDNA